MERTEIYNGKIITPYRIIEKGSILIEDGKIKQVREGNAEVKNAVRINAHNFYVSPGFIDIHTHGAGGYDYLDGTAEAMLGASRMQAVHGVTSVVPTASATSYEELLTLFDNYREAKQKNITGAQFLGIHLEGPYFSMKRKGAQDQKYIINPKREEYKKILDQTDDIIRWSAAPELDGALEFGRYVSSRGILPSIAHSDATYDEVVLALENGYTHVTHLYNAMSGITRKNCYRYGGVIESAFLLDQLTVEIIADGSHLPPCLLKLAYKIKGPSRVALITDSMRGAGMGPGESIVGSLKHGLKVIIEDGVAKLPDRSVFASSVATADLLVRNMVEMAGVPLADAVQMMTSTPAGISGFLQQKGTITEGKDADIVIFDERINIKATIIKGREVWSTINGSDINRQ
ncbi:MAG: N-acetylglucosamine-6-phosphate deacetylase [Prolixibacteraceae bacterium]|nr:N-acetylglucosamine-6-phosphate deacetylase [Prolixibacteraceae bacterium]